MLRSTDFIVFVLVSFFSSTGLNAMALAVASPFKRPRVAYIFAFLIAVLAIIFAIVCAVGSMFVIYNRGKETDPSETESFTDAIFYSPYINLSGLRHFLYFFPFTHYLRVLDSMVTTTASFVTYDGQTDERITFKGSYYGWKSFALANNMDGRKYREYQPAPEIVNLVILLALNVTYVVVAWYFAQVFDSGNGATKPFYFFLTRSYWFGEKRESLVRGDTIGIVKEESRRDRSIRLHKVSKTFKDITALKELSLEMRAGEVFCFLGHNGAGKSTTINIVSGQTGPTHGYCFVDGLDVSGEMELIRPLIGFCPQDDVLWPDLSASEHLE